MKTFNEAMSDLYGEYIVNMKLKDEEITKKFKKVFTRLGIHDFNSPLEDILSALENTNFGQPNTIFIDPKQYEALKSLTEKDDD
jgi:hypothetical protein